MITKEEKKRRRHVLKDAIDQYYTKEMLITLLVNGFSETEICTELRSMMKRICNEEEGIKKSETK